jgi:uncharacterized protein YecT (DUF1311 family)
MRVGVAKAGLVACAALMLTATGSRSDTDKPDAADSATVQSCIKSASDRPQRERCIGIIADPCAEQPDAESTAGQMACAAREFAVWDDILNETYRRLRAALDARQKVKFARHAARVDRIARAQLRVLWDFFRGTMASPMNAFCRNRETARRAIFCSASSTTPKAGEVI